MTKEAAPQGPAPAPAPAPSFYPCPGSFRGPPHLHAQRGLALIHQPPPHVVKQLQRLRYGAVAPGAGLPPLPVAAREGRQGRGERAGRRANGMIRMGRNTLSACPTRYWQEQPSRAPSSSGAHSLISSAVWWSTYALPPLMSCTANAYSCRRGEELGQGANYDVQYVNVRIPITKQAADASAVPPPYNATPLLKPARPTHTPAPAPLPPHHHHRKVSPSTSPPATYRCHPRPPPGQSNLRSR